MTYLFTSHGLKVVRPIYERIAVKSPRQMALIDRRSDSNIPIVLTIAIALLAVYAFAVGNYFAKTPSSEMSREVMLAETTWAYSGTLRPQVVAMPSSDGKTATILAVDGAQTRLYHIDVRGTVLDGITLNIDLSQSSQLTGYDRAESRMTVFHNPGSLNRIDIERVTGTYREQIVDPHIESYMNVGSRLVIEKSDGLYGLDADGVEAQKLIVGGPVLYYDMDITHGDIRIVTATRETGTRFDIRLIQFDPSFNVIQDLMILNDTSDDHYRRLQDIQVQGELLAMLFLWRDNKYNRNYLTVRRVRLDTGELIDETQTHVPILNSRYTFIGGDAESVSFLMRYRTAYGYNLVKCTLPQNGDPVYTEFTKTRPLSIPAGYFDIDGQKGLVFSDVADGRRTLYYASDQPDLMERTARWTGAILGRALSATVITMTLALFLGGIYLFLISIVPFLVVAGLHRILKPNPYKKFILCAIGAGVYTGLKLYVTFFIIRKTQNYQFRAPWLGGEPHIYVVLIAMSAVAYLLIARFLRPSQAQKHSLSGSFGQFLLIDSVHYSLVFILYGVTTLLINKI